MSLLFEVFCKNIIKLLFLLLIILVFVSVLVPIYFRNILHEIPLTTKSLSEYGQYLTGVAALFAVVLSAPEIQKYFNRKKDERVSRALVAARNFIDAIFFVASPFSFQIVNKGEENRDRLIRERNERITIATEDIQKFNEIIRDADLYLNEIELNFISGINEIWLNCRSGFKMHLIYSDADITNNAAIKAWEEAFVSGEIKKKLENIKSELTKLIRKHNERYL